jgi:hypothetical protein
MHNGEGFQDESFYEGSFPGPIIDIGKEELYVA